MGEDANAYYQEAERWLANHDENEAVSGIISAILALADEVMFLRRAFDER
jgi:hypothetical protein